MKAAALVLVILLVAACTRSTSQPPSETGGRQVLGTGDFVVSSVARADGDLGAARRAVPALDALAVDLYRELAETPGNLLLSPYSIAIALAMTRAGAVGDTADEMDRVLHASLAGEFQRSYGALDQVLNRRSGTYTNPNSREQFELVLESANQLWAQRGMAFDQAFLDQLASNYGAGVRLADFQSEPEPSRVEINRWVSERTRERIPELIPKDVIDSLTRFVIVNAIYLKAKWQSPFSERATRPAPFQLIEGGRTTVQMMHSGGSYDYGRGSGYQAVRLPYVGGLSMIVLVPDAGTFSDFETGLNAKRLEQVSGGLSQAYVSLGLPKFEFRSQSRLESVLSTLGMPIAFDPNRADFSKVTTDEPLYLKAVVHEAFIAVDEDGTEAAAATAVVGGATGGPSDVVNLTIDRPFIFLIRDDETGATLFMGRVLDPN